MTESSCMPIQADDINTLVPCAIGLVQKEGSLYDSSEYSMNAGNQIREVFNSHLIWKEPRRRLYVNSFGPKFRLGLAVARFFYLLSGSNHLAPISFYSASVAKFSDDGVIVPGSSYGHRIFGNDNSGGQFEKVAQLIRHRPNTKRAEIAIYDKHDAGRISKDIPCASMLVFMPREKLHVTLQMRANDVAKLLPYNLFEFSLLLECMAAQTQMEVGDFHHTAVSLHLRGSDITLPSPNQNISSSPQMLPITTFSNHLRLQLVGYEHLIRTQVAHQGVSKAHQWFMSLTDVEPAWLDLLGVVLLEAMRCLHTNSSELVWLKERMLSHSPQAIAIQAY